MLLFLGSAWAATTCMTVDAFNATMAGQPVDTLTLTFDVTGVDPDAFAGSKGALADLTDLGCAAGGSLALKVYGPEYPPNTVHPSGTLKHEYGYNCGPMPYTETWAEPNASAVVFVDGTERCDVTIWIDPQTFGYSLDCDHGLFEGVGDNTPAMPVDHVTLFALTNPDTWHIDAAVSTTDEVCFPSEAPPTTTTTAPPTGSARLGAVEDATAAIDYPATVFPDEADLCVEAGYCEAYVKFDLSSVPGTITSAELVLAAHDDGSANGSGAEVWEVANAPWSESTLTWDTRPATVGAVLGRAAPIVAGGVYTMDVTDAVTAGVVSFALRPGPSDTDGAHFVSTEAGDSPQLVVGWVEDGGDPGTTPTDGTTPPPDTTLPADDENASDARGGCGCAGGPAPGLGAGLVLLGLARRRSVW